MSKTLKVAAFRAAADHLFRLANVDYHACVGAHELGHWRAVAGRVLAGLPVTGLETGPDSGAGTDAPAAEPVAQTT